MSLSATQAPGARLDPEAVLSATFGYGSFRPMQRQAIDSVLAGRDTVVIMPTGGGKSLCYQVPALCAPGVALVVSPLIALMRDQVEALKAYGVEAAYLNSSQTAQESRQTLDALNKGRLKLVYISPERLLMKGTSELIAKLDVSLVAIDEAHCISAWGHDFRPEYLGLGAIKSLLPGRPVMALTATADRLTRQDIVTRLSLEAPLELVSSFDRPNIWLEVEVVEGRPGQISRFIRARPGQAGIVYCHTRQRTEQMAARLANDGIRAAAYHAGLPATARAKVQDDFLRDDLDVVCATVAFGMGIDKSNVRWVIHFNLPKNLEGYYQEIGRAGRDGLPAQAILYYTVGDVLLHREMIARDKLDETVTEVALAKLERMQAYAESLMCRRRVLLAYFGEDLGTDCGHCDVCLSPPERIDGTELTQMALSAAARTEGTLASGQLVDLLRGTVAAGPQRESLRQIKTYGVGKGTSAALWRAYLSQMMQLGLLEIAYDRSGALSVTPAGWEVLRQGRRVELAMPAQAEARQKARQQAAAAEAAGQSFLGQTYDEHAERLMGQLKARRKELADERRLPPYVIFSDASLQDMARHRPASREEFLQVSGVGAHKADEYGPAFLAVIEAYRRAQADDGIEVGQPARVAHKQTKAAQGRAKRPYSARSASSLLQAGAAALKGKAPEISIDGPDPEPLDGTSTDTKPLTGRASRNAPPDTRTQTLDLYRQGLTPPEIAQARDLAESTIYAHLCELYLAGQDVDLTQYVDRAQYKRVREAYEQTGTLTDPALAPIHQLLGGHVPYDTIRLSRALLLRRAGLAG